MSFTVIQVIASALLAVPVAGHMYMRYPAPRRAGFNPDYAKKGDVDYDLNAPLGSVGEMRLPYPCGPKKGPVSATFKAGQTVNWKLDGDTDHNGGHCEVSLSYDDKTFVSIQTILGTCMKNGVRDYQVTIPANAPAGPATFAWTWVNWEGNREYYMNCADINIDGNPNGVLTGPKIVEVNMPGKPTIPEFTSVNTGVKFYENRPNVSVTGKGIIGPINPPTDPEPTTVKPPVTKPSSTIHPVEKPTTKPHIPKPQPTTEPTKPEKPKPSTPTEEKCEDFAYQCTQSGYRVCVWGKWVDGQCAGGTQCYQASKSNILCV
jgi:cell division septation protein DedD